MEWETEPPTLHSEFVYMFSISAGIIAVSFFLAFSRSALHNPLTMLIRNACSLSFNTFTTWLSIKSGMYMASREMAAKANALKDRENKMTAQMKANVMREKNNLEKIKVMQQISGIERKSEDDTNDGSSTRTGTTGKGTFGKLSMRPTGLTTPSTPGLLTPRTTGLPESPAVPYSPGLTSFFLRTGRRTPSGNNPMEDAELGQRQPGPAPPGNTENNA